MSNSSLRQLLREQYSAIEDYCNAQTSFRNTIVARQDSSISGSTSTGLDRQLCLNQALMNHQVALDRVDDNLHALHQLLKALSPSNETTSSQSPMKTRKTDSTALQQVLSQHLQRSERVLQTIFMEGGGAFHPNGLPVPMREAESESTSSALMVALSSLRASIQLVQEHLPQSEDQG